MGVHPVASGALRSPAYQGGQRSPGKRAGSAPMAAIRALSADQAGLVGRTPREGAAAGPAARQGSTGASQVAAPRWCPACAERTVPAGPPGRARSPPGPARGGGSRSTPASSGSGWPTARSTCRAPPFAGRPVRAPDRGTVGVHGKGGSWLANGSAGGLVEIEIDPPCHTERCLSTWSKNAHDLLRDPRYVLHGTVAGACGQRCLRHHRPSAGAQIARRSSTDQHHQPGALYAMAHIWRNARV